jgi:hypothetical protein
MPIYSPNPSGFVVERRHWEPAMVATWKQQFRRLDDLQFLSRQSTSKKQLFHECMQKLKTHTTCGATFCIKKEAEVVDVQCFCKALMFSRKVEFARVSFNTYEKPAESLAGP